LVTFVSSQLSSSKKEYWIVVDIPHPMKLNLYPYSLTRLGFGYGYIATYGVHYYHQANIKKGKW